MTFDSAVSTTYETALTDLRDNVSSLTGWSLTEDAWAGSDYFVLQNPDGEYIKIGNFGVSDNGIEMEWGDDYDAGSSSWNNQWQNKTGEFDAVKPAQGFTQVAWGDPVTYWMNYVADDGFMLYIQREEGDGNDGDMAIGFADVKKTWDYTAAANVEAEWCFWWEGYNPNDNGEQHTRNSMPWGGARTHGEGIVNPDANFSNYPYHETVLQSSQYQNASGDTTVIGTHEFWVWDKSGGDSAHRDTIQDSGGTNIYTILKRNVCEIGMGMA